MQQGVSYLNFFVHFVVNVIDSAFQRIDDLDKLRLFTQEHHFDILHLLLIANGHGLDSQFHVLLLLLELDYLFFEA